MIAWTQYPEGNHRTTCPACGRGDRDKTLGITVESGRGVAHCFRCEFVATHREDRSRVYRAQTQPKPATPKHETLSDYGRSLWAACGPLAGTVGELYLRHRRCVIPPADGDLRFHPSLGHKPSGKSGPALVARVTHVVSGTPMSLHRTWITPTGKADLDPPRMLLGNHLKQGGVVRLWPDDYLTHGLAVAEGIETALSLAHAYAPVWACIDAGNMAALPVLAGVECLVIAQDRDPAGLAAANTCAARWAAGGAVVSLTRQSENDLNDTLCEVAA
jgi:hypothetical protein